LQLRVLAGEVEPEGPAQLPETHVDGSTRLRLDRLDPNRPWSGSARIVSPSGTLARQPAAVRWAEPVGCSCPWPGLTSRCSDERGCGIGSSRGFMGLHVSPGRRVRACNRRCEATGVRRWNHTGEHGDAAWGLPGALLSVGLIGMAWPDINGHDHTIGRGFPLARGTAGDRLSDAAVGGKGTADGGGGGLGLVLCLAGLCGVARSAHVKARESANLAWLGGKARRQGQRLNKCLTLGLGAVRARAQGAKRRFAAPWGSAQARGMGRSQARCMGKTKAEDLFQDQGQGQSHDSPLGPVRACPAHEHPQSPTALLYRLRRARKNGKAAANPNQKPHPPPPNPLPHIW
jgi:hypothetical protein